MMQSKHLGGVLPGRNHIRSEPLQPHHGPFSHPGQPQKRNPPTVTPLSAFPVMTIKIMGAFKTPRCSIGVLREHPPGGFGSGRLCNGFLTQQTRSRASKDVSLSIRTTYYRLTVPVRQFLMPLLTPPTQGRGRFGRDRVFFCWKSRRDRDINLQKVMVNPPIRSGSPAVTLFTELIKGVFSVHGIAEGRHFQDTG
jgi:hypothetical protein